MSFSIFCKVVRFLKVGCKEEKREKSWNSFGSYQKKGYKIVHLISWCVCAKEKE